MDSDITAGSGPGLDRRSFLRFTTLGISALGTLGLGGCGLLSARESVSTVGEVDFNSPLNIPPIATSKMENGRRVFDLVIQTGRVAILPTGEAETWGVNGPLLGPTLRARRGEEVLIHVRNTLGEATTLHWHGMHLPAEADGGPHQMIDPGGTWSPSWTVHQPAATLWYHPHPHGQTERHVYKGLGGLFLVDDDVESGLDLPRDYGVDDVPIIVQDKTFDDGGNLVDTERRDNGMLGNTILINGTVGAVFEVTTERTRLRLLNASTARSYSFGLADDRPFDMIASDGGLLPQPERLTRIMLTPGERAEIIIELSAGETLTLRSFPQELGISARRAESTGARDTLDILQLNAAAKLRRSAAIPAQLSEKPTLDPAAVATTRSFELGDNRINGERMDMSRIDAVVPVDTTEIWEVVNTHSQPHNFHVHDVQFQILDIDGEPPPPVLAGWKDTIYTPPDVTYRLIMRFAHYTNPDVPYMYHCHLLWHEDQGMMGQFTVVDSE